MHPSWEMLGTSWWFYVQMAFTIGMMIHAYRSGAEGFWFWVILFFQPFGAWIYFFVVFVRNFHFGRIDPSISLWQRRTSLKELRFHVERAPTITNRLALAERLMEMGEHKEAIPLLDAVLEKHEDYCQALHDLALCHLACEHPAAAVAVLKRLLQRDFRWSYYRAWRTLIDAHVACQQPEEALKASRELEKMVPTLEHKCLLAEHLLENNLAEEAVGLLDRGLEDYAFTPWNRRLKNWRWARLAQRLLREAQAG